MLKGLELGIEYFSQAGSPVVVPTPAYPPFFTVTRGVPREVIEAPLGCESGTYVLDLDTIEAGLRRGARTVILRNPNNPVGRSFAADVLGSLAELVDRYGARVIADEVHAPLMYPGNSFTSYSTVSEVAANHSITLTSASKGWNVPALKCAQVLLTGEGCSERRWHLRRQVEAVGWDVCVVVNERDVVLGLLRTRELEAEAEMTAEQVMRSGPATYRPDALVSDVVERKATVSLGAKDFR